MNREALKLLRAQARLAAELHGPDGSIRFIPEPALDGSFCADKGKRIVIAIHPNGVIELWPERTQRKETIHALDVYRFAVRCRVGRGQLEKAREKKAKRAERLARQRQERAERRLVER